MSTTTTIPFRDALERTITDTVAPSALEVDRDATFPTQNIRALGEAGILGLLSSADVAAGRHLSTLAFSESGSRSHFWAPLGTATQVNGHVRLDARKSWVTSAGQADSYVWSSRALAADGMSMWFVPSR